MPRRIKRYRQRNEAEKAQRRANDRLRSLRRKIKEFNECTPGSRAGIIWTHNGRTSTSGDCKLLESLRHNTAVPHIQQREEVTVLPPASSETPEYSDSSSSAVSGSSSAPSSSLPSSSSAPSFSSSTSSLSPSSPLASSCNRHSPTDLLEPLLNFEETGEYFELDSDRHRPNMTSNHNFWVPWKKEDFNPLGLDFF